MSVPIVRTEPTGQAVAIPQEATSIVQLLHLAVERGTPVAELKELVDLHERMERRQAEKDFAEAMAAFQRECPQIKKSSTASVVTKSGGKYSYTYAELDEIVRTVGPILAQHGLSYTWDTAVDKSLLTCTCVVRHIGGHHVESRFTLPTDASSPGMNSQQAVGAALTYARRQSLVAAIGLTMTDEDTDGIDPTPITEDQVTMILDLLQETGANHQKFLEYINATSVSLIRASDFDRAVRALRAKRKVAP
jgi:ERF superfamily protein